MFPRTVRVRNQPKTSILSYQASLF